MSMLDPSRPLLCKLGNGSWHCVATPFFQVAYDEEARSVEAVVAVDCDVAG